MLEEMRMMRMFVLRCVMLCDILESMPCDGYASGRVKSAM